MTTGATLTSTKLTNLKPGFLWHGWALNPDLGFSQTFADVKKRLDGKEERAYKEKVIEIGYRNRFPITP